jgi:hypothetical protein
MRRAAIELENNLLYNLVCCVNIILLRAVLSEIYLRGYILATKGR